MRLATLKSSTSRDGELVVINQKNTEYVSAGSVAPNLRTALEKWNETSSKLEKIYADLNQGVIKGSPFKDFENFESVLPRTWLFADGSAFLHHVKLVRKARNAEIPESLYTVPLMYQAECGSFLRPTQSIPQKDFSHGTDFEWESVLMRL
jgi:fumarylacetoacetate (FAA) hydrolase